MAKHKSLTVNPIIKKQAIMLAKANKRAEPNITKVYWFPHNEEVRLVELENNVGHSRTKYVAPFYFDSSPEDELLAPSAIALIRSNEFRKLQLPRDWGTWDDAQELKL